MRELLTIADFALTLLWWIVTIHIVMSWLIQFNIINTQNDAVRAVWNALDRILEPVYRPIRKVLPDFGGLDLSPLVVLLAISLLNRLVAIEFGRLYAIGY